MSLINPQNMASGDKCKKTHEADYKRLNPSCIIRTLVQLMQDSISADHITRQQLLLDDFISGSPCGFWVHDLSYITEVIEIITERMINTPSFEPYLESLLELSAFPPMLMNFCSLTDLQNDVVEYFSFFGYMLVNITDLRYQKLIFKSVLNNLERKICPSPRAISIRAVHEAIECSKLAEIISNLMEIAEDDLYFELLQLANIIANLAPNICYIMLKQEALFTVILRLDPNWKENVNNGVCPLYDEFSISDVKNMDSTLDLIALLLNSYKEASSDIKVCVKSPSVEVTWSLRYILRVLVVEGKKSDRNYFYSILLLFLDCFPDAYLLQSGLLKDITLLGVATEIGTSGTWAGIVRFGVDEEDFQFKKMVLLGIYYSSIFFGGESYFEEKKVINGLLIMIAPQVHLSYSQDRFECIQLTVLTILERLIPRAYKVILTNNGLTKLVGLLENNIPHIVMVACLKCINKLFLIKDGIIAGTYNDRIRSVLKSLIKSTLVNQSLNTETQNGLSYMFSILWLLIHKTASDLNEDVDVCIEFINRVLNLKENDTRYEPKLMICVLSYLWKIIRHNDKQLLHFIENKSLYSLLDIANDAVLPVKNVALGLLVDVCEEGSGIPYLVTWRSNKTTLLNLLLTTFREENKLIRVETTDRGVIIDLLNPIMGEEQKNQSIDNEVSPAITDMDCSCRPKIYAIIQLLQVRHQNRFEVANKYYNIFEQNLTVEDKITKILSENYLAFKIGETWRELKYGLEKTNFQPVYYDKYMLDCVITYYEKLCRDVQELQNSLLSIEYKNDYYTEEQYYNLLRESKLASALKALEKLTLIARSTNARFRNNAHNSSINNARTDEHTTINTTCNVSTPIHQKIILQSDIIVEPMEMPPPSLVSFISTDVKIENNYLKSSLSSINIPQECYNKKKNKKKKETK